MRGARDVNRCLCLADEEDAEKRLRVSLGARDLQHARAGGCRIPNARLREFVRRGACLQSGKSEVVMLRVRGPTQGRMQAQRGASETGTITAGVIGAGQTQAGNRANSARGQHSTEGGEAWWRQGCALSTYTYTWKAGHAVVSERPWAVAVDQRYATRTSDESERPRPRKRALLPVRGHLATTSIICREKGDFAADQTGRWLVRGEVPPTRMSIHVDGRLRPPARSARTKPRRARRETRCSRAPTRPRDCPGRPRTRPPSRRSLSRLAVCLKHERFVRLCRYRARRPCHWLPCLSDPPLPPHCSLHCNRLLGAQRLADTDSLSFDVETHIRSTPPWYAEASRAAAIKPPRRPLWTMPSPPVTPFAPDKLALVHVPSTFTLFVCPETQDRFPSFTPFPL